MPAERCVGFVLLTAAAVLTIACGAPGLTSNVAQAVLAERIPLIDLTVVDVWSDGIRAVARVEVETPTGPRELDAAFEFRDSGWVVETLLFHDKSLGVEEFQAALNWDLQHHTRDLMLNLSVANQVMHADTGHYASDLMDLQDEGYMVEVFLLDAWGNAFVYGTDQGTFTLVSFGCDGRAGPAPPNQWIDAPCEPDLILTDAGFSQSPTGRRAHAW